MISSKICEKNVCSFNDEISKIIKIFSNSDIFIGRFVKIYCLRMSILLEFLHLIHSFFYWLWLFSAHVFRTVFTVLFKSMIFCIGCKISFVLKIMKSECFNTFILNIPNEINSCHPFQSNWLTLMFDVNKIVPSLCNHFCKISIQCADNTENWCRCRRSHAILHHIRIWGLWISLSDIKTHVMHVMVVADHYELWKIESCGFCSDKSRFLHYICTRIQCKRAQGT